VRRIFRWGSIVLLLTAICVVDSDAKKSPKVPPDPKYMAIENISVLPIVDARAGKKAGVNLEHLQTSVVNIVKKKHYPASAASTSGEAGEIAEEDLQSALAPFLRKLGPADARWVMVVCLEDVVSKITFGSTGNAELSGYLFDKDSGGVVWMGKGVGQAGQGGLMGMAMKGMMTSAAIDSAVSNLLGSMPNRPKPDK
jgi:hypothetical protein